MKPPHFTLSQQGYILIAVPLAFELIFVMTLGALLKQAQVSALEQARIKTLLLEANRMPNLFFEAGSSLARLAAQEGDAENQYDQALQDIQESTRIFLRQVQSNPEEQELARRLRALSDKGTDLMIRAKQRLDEARGESPLVRIKLLRRETKPLLSELVPELRKYVDTQGRPLETGALANQIKANELVELSLKAGVVLNMLLAIILVVYFNRSTLSRLRIMLENTLRLVKQEPLHEPLSGQDELADLDHTFHNMAAELAEARRRETAIIQNAVDVICSLSENGRFIAMNAASAAAWGYPPERLVGRDIMEIVPDSHRKATADSIRRIISDQSAGSFENEILRADGRALSMLWSVQWVPSERAIFCVAHDITERRELERLKQEFVAMASHDLRSPLFAIQCSLTLVNEGVHGNVPPAVVKELTTAERNVARLISLINDLLDMEKMEAGKLELNRADCSIMDVIRRSIESVQALADNASISIKIEGKDADVFADADRVVQVVVNFLANAIKFSPPSGTIIVAASEIGEWMEVKVIDQGPGIPSEYRDTVFDRFHQVAGSSKQGTGLGLAICKAIIEQHGGSVGVQSKTGEGSTFWFRIPLVPAALPQSIRSDP